MTTPETHWKQFAEFVRWERAVGGPDPHLTLVGEMSVNAPWMERIWRGGCYIGVYNTPGAEQIWTAWPFHTVRLLERAEPLIQWLREHWIGIPTRRERRAIRQPEKLGRFLFEYAGFASTLTKRDFAAREDAYEALWDRVGNVYTLGRYVAIKLLEYYNRYCSFPAKIPDIRPRDGWSPREALTLFYPEYEQLLTNSSDTHENIANINVIAEHGRQYLAEAFGIELDHFLFQVLLCDYKQSAVGHRQYPGRSHDSELGYAATVEAHFGAGASGQMFKARAATFPPEALGEQQGWTGVRKELGWVLARHSYTWSDIQFSYLQSRENLAAPVRR